MRKIAPDKWKHFFIGIVMGVVLQLFFWMVFQAQLLPATLLAFAVVVLISYGFELFSKITGIGHYELMDAVAAIIGGLLGMSIVLFIQAGS